MEPRRNNILVWCAGTGSSLLPTEENQPITLVFYAFRHNILSQLMQVLSWHIFSIFQFSGVKHFCSAILSAYLWNGKFWFSLIRGLGWCTFGSAGLSTNCISRVQKHETVVVLVADRYCCNPTVGGAASSWEHNSSPFTLQASSGDSGQGKNVPSPIWAVH